MSPEPKLGKLIEPSDLPPGCVVLNLSQHAGPGQILVGRDATSESPALVAEHTGQCGDAVRVLRYPTTGLNLPGEDRPVGVLTWCHQHGPVALAHDIATEQERAWEWHTSTVV